MIASDSMDAEILEKIFPSFQQYYTIKKENVTSPFDAEADFISHSEQYLLVKAAKIADIDSNDYAYFKVEDELTVENLDFYAQKAWEIGISKVVPYYGHRNSDVTLVILADKISDDAKKKIRKTKFYKSYKFSFWGWSHFRLVAKELSSNTVYYNRFGDGLKKVLANI